MLIDQLRLKAGRHMVPVTIREETGKLWLKFRFNRHLLEEIKLMKGAKWHGFDPTPLKEWSVDDCARNRFQLQYLEHPGRDDPLNPYRAYDVPLVGSKPRRQVYHHQVDLFQHVVTRRHCIMAAEMRTGKTLVAIEVMEWSGFLDWWWIGPRSALLSVSLEFDKWGAGVRPRMYTYEGLKRLLSSRKPGDPAPHGVVFDESSRGKNPTAQRTQAMQFLADAIRKEHGRDSFIVLMSGSPAPKSPVDWWSQCEIACPGFLREGNVDKFRSRLAVIEYQESPVGGRFPRLVTWRDDERKCGKCGRLEDSPAHDPKNMADIGYFHPFEASENEIVRLYRRMLGLVAVKFKKDCLDLPEKVFRTINLPVSIQTMNLARLVQAKASTAAQALILLRELSDGFQYQLQESGTQACGGCSGSGVGVVYRIKEEGSDLERELAPEEIAKILGEGGTLEQYARPGVCPVCNGAKRVASFSRESREVATPKEQALVDQLDEHDEVGRLVVYAGFLGSVDRIVRVCLREKWEVIRVDGRGWLASWGERDPKQMMLAFQSPASDAHPRVVFVGQPGAGGMGLDLAASPTILYYSNDFNGESRIQSVERIHGPTMNVNLGATIIDLIHLPTDQLVLDNLNKKRRLQSITMGELQEALAVAEEQGPIDRGSMLGYGEMWNPDDGGPLGQEESDGEGEEGF